MHPSHIQPDHYYDNGGIPVFRPTMDQFRDFSTFVESIASYGRKAGLVKVIPPKEWSAALPDLSERLSTVKIKTPIIQHIRGTKGIYTQTNIESRKSYTVAEFKTLCNDSNHRPPSRKGVPHGPAEPLPKRKRNRKPANLTTDSVPLSVDSAPVTPTHIPDMDPFASPNESDGIVPSSTTASANSSPDQPSLATLGPNNARKHFLRHATSPSPPSRRPVAQDSLSSLLPEPKVVTDKEATSTSVPSSTTTSSNKKEAKQAEEEKVEPPMTDYKVEHGEDFTVDYCKDVERNYWRNLTFVQPMYGADMSGSLFDSRTTSWNTQCLGDLLTRKLVKKVPGVNTPYLYFGMWKATFAWHVEDMDLYSINYLHFGAPKQWYCIPPDYSERFERIAQGIFSQDFKQCPQFLRHKTHLISPSILSNDGVPFNRLVQHEGEFVLTFPFAYHSGYNLGFNCAESINFALENWIDIGRKAESCRCITDSVQIDVEAIFRSSRDTAMETDDNNTAPPRSRSRAKKEDVEMKEPESSTGTAESLPPKKRRRPGTGDDDTSKTSLSDKHVETRSGSTASAPAKVKSEAPVSKKSKVTPATQECILCPLQDIDSEMLPTDKGKFCHMICAQYIPETYMSGEDDSNVIVHADLVPAARRKLKCFLCDKKQGACVQCCKGKCVRAMHASCAEKADMYVEEFQMEDEDESIQYRVHCPTHDPRQTKEKQAEFKGWKEMMGKKLKSGLSVYARWNDNIYYAGVIEKVYADKMNCKIQFNDGYNKTVTWKDISLDKKPPVVAA
ncbi:hypothetical protein BGZ93_002489 [Podila epicladia]|nr:hypothetical protein BGZ92_006015 [Podila epicladia]KAG0097555.1 hypothetical protein BGZ93_002489 [Podila epicladia]